jgi:hypothetical protein
MKTVEEYRLIQYRDAGMSTYTFFWVNAKNQVISDYFDSEAEARDWMNPNKRQPSTEK